MIVYRITKSKHASDISGTGAALFPGRWNQKGTPVLYTGQSIEIALLENIVHAPPMITPDLDILTLEIPDDSILELKISDLPSNWSNYPAPTILSQIGQEWVNEGKEISLKIPSCIIHTSHNYILNCQHKDFNRVKVIDHSKFYFDPRLIK
ncbi:RES family NAD+ phosphorylase [Flavobacterium sp.]|jgi:RES domain-containing protein|uniref:RES family NAD+ phosphorylase n=1 Tax=Flavobacterium sp. TaxID=239 RepID=UPI00391BBD48